jgi:hypothetical protein
MGALSVTWRRFLRAAASREVLMEMILLVLRAPVLV